MRDKIAKAPPDDAFYQFAKELLAMSAAPHRFDNDPVHGKTLEEQQILASKLVEKPSPLTEEDIIETFQQQRSATKSNLIQAIANKNKWKNSPPKPDVARHIGEEAWREEDLDDSDYHTGRTIPSQNIPSVDRSDRVGEDKKMGARVDIQAKGKGVDQELLDIIEAEEMHQQKQKKDDWKSTLSDVDNLLKDD
ncbi:hypothetical protein N9X31_00510 [Candidatus Poseidoniales archaeon]|nr:hypothetical protein [Candidatus Poseidoniales archaeon]